MKTFFGLVIGCLILVGTVGNVAATTINLTNAAGTTFNFGSGQSVTVKAFVAVPYWYPYADAGITRHANGLGLKNYGNRDGSPDSILLDGRDETSSYIGDERLIFTFSEEVTLTATGFSYVTSVDDFDLAVDGIDVLIHADALESVIYSSALITSGSLTGTRFAFTATENNDAFLIRSLTIADPAAHAPEPATAMLFGFGLLGLLRIKRKI